jgi:SAM-dependent methyltransferase
VETTGCRLFGVDLHDEGVAAANRAPQERGLADRARFVCADARKTLPVDAGSFDAVICIDSINHMYERSAVLREWRRVLRPSGRVLFTDPITVTGLLRREEMILRGGAMGEFVFTPRRASTSDCWRRPASLMCAPRTSPRMPPASPRPGLPPASAGPPTSTR